MAYVSSNNNRFYVALEPSYGTVGTITSGNRIPALKLTAKQVPERVQRKDKTGSRTFVGLPGNLRKATQFDLTTYMSTWADQSTVPAYGPLFQACLGAAPALWGGGTAAGAEGASRIAFAGAHGLAPGEAVSSGGELRFVAAVVDPNTVQLNAPFGTAPATGASLGPTVTYQPASDLASLSIFDYWSPDSAVQRVLSGVAVNQLKIKVNGDFHEFEFSGEAADVVDNTSFTGGEASLTSFPPEPAIGDLDTSIVPGHLGQIWLGSVPTQFFTVTKAQLTFDNTLDLRASEFGSTLPRAIVPGLRSVTLDFSLYQQDDSATKALYQAARQRSPIGVMIQLGQQPGQLFGIYMDGVIPEVPEFDDSETRQQWQFQNCRAQGSLNDEIFVAFA
jgi:hypothetical protein